MAEFTEEFDYILSRGWWFSIIPEGDGPKKWRCSIYKKKGKDNWESVTTENFPTITKGMVWIELYLMAKLDELDD